MNFSSRLWVAMDSQDNPKLASKCNARQGFSKPGYELDMKEQINAFPSLLLQRQATLAEARDGAGGIHPPKWSEA